MDRLLLIISTFCFLFGFAYTMHALGARVYRHSPLNFFAILTGFAFQSAFLYLRGQKLGRCPLSNLFEVLIFLSWSMVLLYLLTGPTYRLSLMGAFTSPLVFFLQIAALLLVPWLDLPSKAKLIHNTWLELHAALSIIAYGAFALASVAGVMYLAQERQLKSHNLHSIFYHLPPIRDLGVANRRLLLAGFALLSVGLGAGFAIGEIQSQWTKILWSSGVWLLYAGLLVAIFLHKVSGRRVAWLSACAFLVVLSTLWGLHFIADSPQP